MGMPPISNSRLRKNLLTDDSSIGMLLGYHLLWTTTANVVGTPEQADRWQEKILSNNYFVGGAVNPRNSDLKITSDGEDIVFNGTKFFNTGGVVSDVTVLEGVLDGTQDHIFTIVQTRQPGIQFAHDWDNVGLRLTESGGIKLENVRAPWKDAFGWDSSSKKPIPEILTVPFATLLLPT
jgi:alkylation response protein AidB-like acyl-CoA dehydrogenase